jgi:hypothetical protein
MLFWFVVQEEEKEGEREEKENEEEEGGSGVDVGYNTFKFTDIICDGFLRWKIPSVNPSTNEDDSS